MTKKDTPTEDRSIATLEERSINENDLTVDIIASTPKKDRHGTRLDQSGWELGPFLRVPVITYSHDDRGYTASAGLPIANAIPSTVRVEDGKLKMKVKFTPEDVNEFGFKVWKLVKAGFLHAVSVGFRVLGNDVVEEEDGSLTPVFTRMELLEVAFVTIPSNDEALIQRAAEKTGMAEDEVRSVICEVEKSAEEKEQEYVDMCVRYFKRKKPANKEATKVLKDFFVQRNMQQPSDEAEAWKKMREIMEDEEDTTIVDNKVDDKKEEEAPTTEPAPAPTSAEPEPQPSAAPNGEAEQAAPVQLSYNDLDKLVRNITQGLFDEAVAALQRGTPVSDLPHIMKEAGKGLRANMRDFLATSHN